MTQRHPERTKRSDQLRRQAVNAVVDRLICALLEIEGVTEAQVLYSGDAPPYRRVDCAHRVLAYVYPRPRYRGARMEVTMRWKVRASRLEVSSSRGTALVIASDVDIVDAVTLIEEAVERGPKNGR